MDTPWIIHGLSMDNPWIIHGLSMDIQGYPWLSMEYLASVWGHVGITLELLWHRFDATLVSLWGHCESLWGHSGISVGSFWDNFGISFGSLCDQFGINSKSVWRQSGHPGAITQMIPTGSGYGFNQFGIP